MVNSLANRQTVAALNTQHTSLLLTPMALTGTATVEVKRYAKRMEVNLPLAELTEVACMKPSMAEVLGDLFVLFLMSVVSLFLLVKGAAFWGGVCLIGTLVYAFFVYYERRIYRFSLRTGTTALTIPYKAWEDRDVCAFVEQVNALRKGVKA